MNALNYDDVKIMEHNKSNEIIITSHIHFVSILNIETFPWADYTTEPVLQKLQHYLQKRKSRTKTVWTLLFMCNAYAAAPVLTVLTIISHKMKGGSKFQVTGVSSVTSLLS